MYSAAHSTFAAGIALVGASAIAITPIDAASPFANTLSPAYSSSSVGVDLMASDHPVGATWGPWGQLPVRVKDNIEAFTTAYVLNPAPVARQILDNAVNYASDALVGIALAGQAGADFLTTSLPAAIDQALINYAVLDGTIAESVAIVLDAVQVGINDTTAPLIPVFGIHSQIAQNFANAAAYLTSEDTVNSLVTAFSDPFFGAVQALADSATRIMADIKAGYPDQAAQELSDAPGWAIMAFLNGYKANWLDDTYTYTGILTSADIVGLGQSGALQTVLEVIPQGIAAAITPAPGPLLSPARMKAPKSAAALDASSKETSTSDPALPASDHDTTTASTSDNDDATPSPKDHGTAGKASGGKGHSRGHRRTSDS